MALKRGGIELVVKNFNKFVYELGRVSKAQENLGRSSTDTARRTTAGVNQVLAAITRQAMAYNNVIRAQTRLTAAQEQHERSLRSLRRAHNNIETYVERAIAARRELDAATQDLCDSENAYTRALNASSAQLERNNQVAGEANAALSGAGGAGAGGGGGIGAMLAGAGGIGATLTVISGGVLAVIGGFTLLSSVIGTVIGAVTGLADAIGRGLVGAFKLLLGVINLVTAPLRALFTGAVTAGVNLFRTAIQGLTDDFLEVLGEFQRFQMLFEALSARDLSAKFGMPMAQAFQNATAQAQDLFDWVKRLAVTTPFTAKNISQVVAMANAMGLNIGAAKELTYAVGNFTAGMGLTEEHMWRIIYNFGQMLAQGKVTGREFRDLAISFVPVWRLLDNMAQKAGMATTEFKKLALEGGVPVEAFFKEFIQMAEQDFPNAMDRMAKTWAGVISNARDFVEVVLGTELLGKVFNRITTFMAESLQRLIIVLRPIAQLLGKQLNWAMDALIPSAKALSAAFDELIDTLGLGALKSQFMSRGIATLAVVIRTIVERLTSWLRVAKDGIKGTFDSIAQNAGVWGYNIVAMFASGMAKAINLVTMVINAIASVISWLLSPGSPPRVLPDLPKWGMQAMAEYLHGFTMADFDVLEGIQDPLKEALSILADTGEISEKAAGKRYKDISMAIAEALSSGNIEESLFRDIARAAGPFGEEIALLARRHIELAQAVDALKEAELALEAARKHEEQMRLSINTQVREYNKMIRAGANKASLKAKLMEINATEEAARLATEQRKESEIRVDTLKEQVELLKEAVQLQEKIVQQLLDITREQIIKVELDTKAAGAGIDALEGMFDDLAMGIQDDLARYKFPEIEALKQKKQFSDALKAAEDAVNAFFKNMETAMSPVNKSLSKLESALNRLFGKKEWSTLPENKKGESRLETIVRYLKEFRDVMKDIWTQFTTQWLPLWDTFNKNLEELGVEGGGIGLVKLALDGIAWAFGQVSLKILQVMWFFTVLSGILATIKGNFEEAKLTIGGVGTAFEVLGRIIAEKLTEKLTDAKEQIGEKLNAMKEHFKTFRDKIEEFLGDAKEAILDFRDYAIAKYDEVKEKISTFFTTIGLIFSTQGFKYIYDTWIKPYIDSFKNWVYTQYDAIKTKISTFLLTIREFFRLQGFKKIYDEYIKPHIDSAVTKVQELVDIIRTTLQNAFNIFTGSRFMQTLQDIINKISSVIRFVGNLIDAINDIPNIPGGGSSARAATNPPATGSGSSGGGKGKTHQYGGGVSRGWPTIVGERGWEMYLPFANGVVLSQHQIARVIQSAMSASTQFATKPMLYHALNAPMKAQPVMAVSRTVNVNFGNVIIANDMDMATFEARVKRVIRQEFK